MVSPCWMRACSPCSGRVRIRWTPACSDGASPYFLPGTSTSSERDAPLEDKRKREVRERGEGIDPPAPAVRPLHEMRGRTLGEHRGHDRLHETHEDEDGRADEEAVRADAGEQPGGGRRVRRPQSALSNRWASI